MLICPASLLGNWERELAEWAPSLRVRSYNASRNAVVHDVRTWRSSVLHALASGTLARAPAALNLTV